MDDIYERYRYIRDSHNAKDSDVAKNTGITKSTFSEWKRGRYTPKQDKLQKIADGTYEDRFVEFSDTDDIPDFV